MNYSKIIYYDTANAHGLSTVLFVSGCNHHCDGCHNPETWNKENGELFTLKVLNEIIESLKKPYIKNFVISGGDPLALYNRKVVLTICKWVKRQVPDINIIVYTGYKIEHLPSYYCDLLFPFIDYLIDGEFDKALKPEKLELRGSVNQRCWQIIHSTKNNYKKFDISDEYFGGMNK